jgi:hypothetical protein
VSDPTFNIPLPADGYAGTAPTDQAAQEAQFYGEDIWFDISVNDPTTQRPDYVVTAAGDWAVATGLQALRQALLRRLITNPGEWQTLPNFGVGAQQYAKALNTAANQAELEGRIRQQFMQDDRVESVSQVTMTPLEGTDDGIMLTVFVVAAGRLRQDKPIPVQLLLTK